MGANQIPNHFLTSPSSPNFEISATNAIPLSYEGQNEFKVSKDKHFLNDHRTANKHYVLEAVHADSDVVEKFFELIEWRLHGIYGMTTMDGDNDDILITWCIKPRIFQIQEMVKAIKMIWELVTMFD